MDDEQLWWDLVALPERPRTAVLTHLGLGAPLDADGERDLARALVALGVQDDLTPRDADQTRAAVARVLATRTAAVQQVLHPTPPPARMPTPAPPTVTTGSRWRSRRSLAVAAGGVVALAAVAAFSVGVVRAADDASAPDPATAQDGPAGSFDGVPVADFTTLAGRWEPVTGGEGESPGTAAYAAFLEFSPYGHWRGDDGCGNRVQGYLSLTSSGRVAATMDVSGLPDIVEGCVPVPVQDALHADQRYLVMQGEQLVALGEGGGAVARMVRTEPPDPGVLVSDLEQVGGAWKQTGQRGDLSSTSADFPLRDVLTFEPLRLTQGGRAPEGAPSLVGNWEARTDACVVAGGILQLGDGGRVAFSRTFRTDQSCSGSPGGLRWRLQETIGLVLEDPTTLVLVDDRGREVARLVAQPEESTPPGG